MAIRQNDKQTEQTNSVSANSLRQRTKEALSRLQQMLLEQRNSEGHWVGELSGSALSTATAISTLSFYLKEIPDSPRAEQIRSQIEQGLSWLVPQQNLDGGWGDTDQSYSNISTTMLVVAALHASERAEGLATQIEKAEAYIAEKGGVPALRKRYGKDKTFAVPILANCAMAGIVEWKEVAALPFEAASVPQKFYHLMQMPVVSYAVPALVAIGQAKFILDPPRNPFVRGIRRAAVGRSLKVLERMQPASGGFLEAVPLTSFVSMALIKSGRVEHPVVEQGVQFILDSFRPEGTWPIDTNLATWNSTLSINALSYQWPEEENVDWKTTLDWILSCQYEEIHPFTGAAPGGWGWTNLSGAVPDADDSPGALLALSNLRRNVEMNDLLQKRISKSAEAGVNWLLDLQNRDRGWPTFCRGWGRFPFDRSGADITAHVLRALLAWKDEFPSKRLEKSIERGFLFLEREQCDDGSWNPLWFGNQDYKEDFNPCYGTAKVLMAYRDAGRFDTHEAEKGLNWIESNQNRDGGWGGGISLKRDSVPLGTSSVEETSLCLETLASSLNPNYRGCVVNGIQWLVSAVEQDRALQSWPIGFYFAKLWYYEKHYPLVFATGALGAALSSWFEGNEWGAE